MRADGGAEIIEGAIENVIYRNESNDYTVMEIGIAEDELIVAVGSIPMAFEGERVILRGNWIYHKEFGKQFAFDSFEKTLPKEVEGILQYLSSRTVKGVGPVTALKIVNRFGTDTFDVMENHPEWLADIPGITYKKAAAISESFKEQTGIRGVMMFCKDFMVTSEITRVYKRLGAGAVGIIKDNPYILCDEDYGIPFDKVDSIAASLGMSPDSSERIYNGLRHILNYNASANGHTCLPVEKLISASAKLLSVDEHKIEQLLPDFLDSGDLSKYKIDNIEMIMTREVAEDEDSIVRNLYRIS